MIRPALIAGLVLGVLSQIPYLKCLNLFFCMLIITGGALAAYLLSNREKKLDAVDGATVGIMFGFFYAFVATIVGITIVTILGVIGIPLGVLSGVSDEIFVEKGILIFVGVLGGFLKIGFNLLFGVVFGAIGGVLFVVLKK